jgi:hypothetical protein
MIATMNWFKQACSPCSKNFKKDWDPFLDGTYADEGKVYPVRWISEQAKDIPVVDLDISKVVSDNASTETKEGNFAEQLKNPSKAFKERSERADMGFPILVSSDGWIIDGSHRLAKGYWLGNKTIKGRIVDLKSLPEPPSSEK